MKDVLNIVFINKSNIINNNEIRSIISSQELNKLDDVINNEITDPIVIPGILTNEDENKEQIDAVFIFSILEDNNINCNMLFKAVRNIRNFFLDNGISFSHYDEYNIEIEELQGLESYITSNEINNLLNLLFADI